MVEATRFDRVAEREGLVVAYPEGVNETWNAGYCCLGRATSGPDDVGFLTRLIDDVAANNRIDSGRVYAVGVSAGAMMAYRLGCDRADRIAGVGSVAGAMVLDACHPAKPLSVIEIHGTADGLVPYDGGRTAGGATQPSPPTPAVAQRWAELNACTRPLATKVEGVVSTSTWSGCGAGTGVKLITIDAGGHAWFAEGLGPLSGAVDATTEIWAFLSSARRTGQTEGVGGWSDALGAHALRRSTYPEQHSCDARSPPTGRSTAQRGFPTCRLDRCSAHR